MLIAGMMVSVSPAFAQDVVFVDDMAEAARQQSRTQLPSLAGRKSLPRHLPTASVARSSAPAMGPAPVVEPSNTESKPHVFGRMASGFKSWFSNDAQGEAPPQQPRQAMGRDRVTPVAYNSPSAAPQRVGRQSNTQLKLRQGDQQVGLLHGLFGSSKSSGDQEKQAQSKPPTSRMQGSRSARTPARRTVRQVAAAPSDKVKEEVSDGVWISDETPTTLPSMPIRTTASAAPAKSPSPRAQAAPTQTPGALPQSMPVVPQPMVSVQDKPASPSTSKGPTRMGVAAGGPLPKVTTPRSTPLMVENPAAQVTSASKSTPQPAASAPQQAKPQRTQTQTKVAAKPRPMPPMPAPAPAVQVLPNPVKVAQQQPPQPTERAVALLAEANQLAHSAESADELTRVVQQCRHVLAIDDSPMAVEYSNKLAAWALNKRGELHADQGQDARAMADFNGAVLKDPGRWRAVHNRGVLLAQQGSFSDAFDAFNRTIELNPEFAKAYSNRASLYVQAGEFQTAMADYKKAIALDPDLVVAHKGRGRVCHVLGDLEQALRHFEAAVLLEPDDASIATCRADLLTDMGHYAQAVRGYQQAVTIDPGLATAYRNLAWLQATCPEAAYRDVPAAMANAERAIELSGAADDISLDTLAAAQASAGQFALAVETIQQAIAKAPASDQDEYRQRLKLYQEGMPFVCSPAGVRQASYTSPVQ